MKTFYESMVEFLRKKESFAVATLFDKTGSAPRSDGAKMMVQADGSITGTIGGGRLEAVAIELARKVIAERETVVQRFDLTSKDAAASDMICGGKGEILVDFIDALDENNQAIYSSAAKLLCTGEKVADHYSGKDHRNIRHQRQQCLVKPDKTMIGSVICNPDLLENLINGPAKISLHSEVFEGQRILVEPLQEGGTVYIFGAGHVSQKIAPLSEGLASGQLCWMTEQTMPIGSDFRVL